MGKRISIYIFGLALAAMGISFIILSSVGAGPMDAVAVGLTQHFGLTVGTWSVLSQLVLLIITAIIEKARPRFEAVIAILIRSCFLDMWLYVVFQQVNFSSSWELKWLTLIVGVMFVGAGIGIYMEAQFPRTPIDVLMIAIHQRFGWSLNRSRTLIECSAVATGFLLGGPVGFGTLVAAVLLGKIIQAANRIMKRLYTIKDISVDA